MLEALVAGSLTCDGLATELGFSGAEAAATLTDLEQLGYLSCSLVGVYLRRDLQPPEQG